MALWTPDKTERTSQVQSSGHGNVTGDLSDRVKACLTPEQMHSYYDRYIMLYRVLRPTYASIEVSHVLS